MGVSGTHFRPGFDLALQAIAVSAVPGQPFDIAV